MRILIFSLSFVVISVVVVFIFLLFCRRVLVLRSFSSPASIHSTYCWCLVISEGRGWSARASNRKFRRVRLNRHAKTIPKRTNFLYNIPLTRPTGGPDANPLDPNLWLSSPLEKSFNVSGMIISDYDCRSPTRTLAKNHRKFKFVTKTRHVSPYS